jgi:hypothetical protein
MTIVILVRVQDDPKWVNGIAGVPTDLLMGRVSDHRGLLFAHIQTIAGANMAAKPSSTKPSTKEAKSDVAVSYNDFKEYEGQRYTGMKIMFLRHVLADLEKQFDHEGAAIGARHTPDAREQRQARTTHAIPKRATTRGRRASTSRHARRTPGVRRSHV